MDKRIATVALALLLVAGVFLAWPASPTIQGPAGPAGAQGTAIESSPTPPPATPVVIPTCAITKDVCQACTKASCAALSDACEASADCKAAADDVGKCLCTAQDASDKAALGPCLATFKAASAEADAAASCLVSHCATECAL